MDQLSGFVLLEERPLPEMNSRGALYRHTATGAELLSIENDDENKVFSICFRTPPSDSTGVAHILEHAVLNGSQKYPVKEPFVELLKGSLKTFVNAFTYPDKTCYPCASQNLQDFYNLIDVYMDAVLHPLIPPHVLQQEGWHYELDQPDGEMIYKGVVYNEMKGALSDPNTLLSELCQQSLFPDNTYRYNSGGDPRVIPELDYEKFKAFHQNYYHPSNARFFWYGDDDPAERLRRSAGYLEGYQALPLDSTIALQPLFAEPKYLRQPYAVGEGEQGKNYVAFNWLVGENNDAEGTLGLSILSHILVGTQASPLRKKLIDSGLGEDLVGTGLEWHLRQLLFTTGLQGVAEADIDQVAVLLEATLAELVEHGIEAEMLAAAMNTIEFQLRENNTGQFPRGVYLMGKTLSTWLHGGDPFAPLAFEAPLNAIKVKLEQGQRYFEGLIEKQLLQNPHRTQVVLYPDDQLNQRQREEEAARLQHARQSMSEADVQAVVETSLKLKKMQETPDTEEALASLPVLRLEDLDQKNKIIPIEVLAENGAQVLYHDINSSGIVYLDVGFDLHSLPQEYIPYLDLFADGLVKMGTTDLDYVRLSQRIGQHTGGISPELFAQAIYGSQQCAAYLMLRGKATLAKAGEMLSIMQDVLLNTHYDNPQRLKQVVLENKARLEDALIPGGHLFVNRRLAARLHQAGWLSEQVRGVSQLFFLRQLLQEMERDWEAVAARLASIRSSLINRQALVCNLTLDGSSWPAFQKQLNQFIAAMPHTGFKRQHWQPESAARPEGLVIPSQVNFVGKGANLYQQGYQLHGSAAVIKNYLRTSYLWEKIRVQGGAYGALLSFDLTGGVFNFLSYRDPNLLDTLKNYDGSADFLRQLKINDSERSKAIIGAIGEMDAYLLPDAKGYVSLARHVTGFDEKIRQHYREQVLSTSAADFNIFAEVLEQVKAKGQVVVLASAEEIAAVNQAQKDHFDVIQVM